MKPLLPIFIALSFVTVIYPVINASRWYPNSKVVYSVVLFSNGEPESANTVLIKPDEKHKLWRIKKSDISYNGKIDQFRLGKFIRHRYEHYISKNFSSTEVHVRSSDADICLMSAMIAMQGLYPDPNNNSMRNQAIPIHTQPENEDEVISMNKNCPKYDLHKDVFMKSKIYSKHFQKYKNITKIISDNTGYKITNYDQILHVYNSMMIETLNKRALPKWTSEIFPDLIAEPALYSFKVTTATRTLSRLKVGPFFTHFYDEVANILRNKNNKISVEDYIELGAASRHKLNVFSTDNLNLGIVLSALEVFDDKWPGFSSALLLELIYDNDTEVHIVRFMYKINMEEIRELSIPNCMSPCPAEYFLEHYSYLITTSWTTDCHYGIQMHKLSYIIAGFVLLSMCYDYIIANYLLYNRSKRSTSFGFITSLRAGAGCSICAAHTGYGLALIIIVPIAFMLYGFGLSC